MYNKLLYQEVDSLVEAPFTLSVVSFVVNHTTTLQLATFRMSIDSDTDATSKADCFRYAIECSSYWFYDTITSTYLDHVVHSVS